MDKVPFWDIDYVRHFKTRYLDNRNIFFPDKNILIFNIPKVGGTTLRKIACEQMNIRDIKNLPTIQNYNLHNLSGITKIAFVRNPWDRLVSLYEEATQNNRSDFFSRNKLRSSSFEKFIEDICNTPDYNADIHFRSQYTFISAPNGQFLIDQLYRFENFTRVLHDIFDSKKDIPILNKSERLSYHEYYSQDLKERVSKRFATDIYLFGFNFTDKNIAIEDAPWSQDLPSEILIEMLQYKSMILYREYGKMAKKIDNYDFSLSKLIKIKLQRIFKSNTKSGNPH